MSLRDKLVAATQAGLEAKQKKLDAEAEDQERRIAKLLAEFTSPESSWNKALVKELERAANRGENRYFTYMEIPNLKRRFTARERGDVYISKRRMEQKISDILEIKCEISFPSANSAVVRFDFSWDKDVEEAARKRQRVDDEECGK